MKATPAAVHVARLHRYMTDRELTDWEDAALGALALLGMDMLTAPRASIQERVRTLLVLMDPAND